MSKWLDWFTPQRVRTTLIVLSSAALALGILTYFVVFFPSGSYSPVSQSGSTTTFSNIPTSSISTSTAFVIPSSTVSTSTATTGPVSTSSLATDFSYPYPLTWNEGNEEFSVTAASLDDTTLTLTLAIQMGNTSECVPINVRYVADEAGTLAAPASPSGANFIFPDTETCEGTPGAIYSQSITFAVNPTVMPLLFTTGGASNQFFQVATSTDGLAVTTPSTTD